jgi:hypothetical protein
MPSLGGILPLQALDAILLEIGMAFLSIDFASFVEG